MTSHLLVSYPNAVYGGLFVKSNNSMFLLRDTILSFGIVNKIWNLKALSNMVTYKTSFKNCNFKTFFLPNDQLINWIR